MLILISFQGGDNVHYYIIISGKRGRDAMGQRRCKRGRKSPLEKKETTEMKVFFQFDFDTEQHVVPYQMKETREMKSFFSSVNS